MSPPNQIFVSYSHTQHDVAMRHVRWLREHGLGVWFDESIRVGESWRDELATAIDSSSLVLFLATGPSVASDHCRKEIAYALDSGKAVLTVYVEDVALPPGLKLALSDLQAFRAFELSEEETREQVVSTIYRLLEQHGEPQDASHQPVAISHAMKVRIRTPSVKTSGPPVIAVLPFAIRGGDSEQRDFGDGIAEEIINGLTRQKGLRVIARASSFRFRDRSMDPREIGAQLNASHLLEGSFRQREDRIRVTAQLIEAASGVSVWSERYEREIADVFEVMDDITREILAALELKLRPAAELPRTSPEAYEAFLGARRAYNHLDLETASELAQKAMELDPAYAPPYSFVAGMEVMKIFFWFSSMAKSLPNIEYFNKLALSLDEDDLVAKTVRLTLRFFVNREYEAAMRESIELLSEFPDSVDVLISMQPMHLALQRYEGSVALLDRLAELDPLAPVVHRFRAETLTLAGRYAEARMTLDHTARLGMPDPMQYGYLAFMQGDVEAIEAQIALLAGALAPDHLYCIVTSARCLFLKERYEEARELLRPLREMARKERYHYLAALTAQLGHDEEAFLDALEEALRVGDLSAFQNYTLGGIWAERFAHVAAGDRYRSILAGVGLDDDALARLDVPTLPF